MLTVLLFITYFIYYICYCLVDDNESELQARSVCTLDLLCWAFQIARGMDYLSSRNVLHGDLTLRNVFLCDDNIVKISDYGLAKNLYKSDNYPTSESNPLKRLALESMSDQIFSVYSDIWGFGKLMKLKQIISLFQPNI